IIRAIAAPPKADPIATARGARSRLVNYFREAEQRYNAWLAYPLLQRLLWPKKKNVVRRALRPEPYLAVAQRNWNAAYWLPMQQAAVESKCPANAFKRDDIFEKLQPRFAWADGLAVHYGQNYRSGYVLVFLLGALAVFLATLPPLLS